MLKFRPLSSLLFWTFSFACEDCDPVLMQSLTSNIGVIMRKRFELPSKHASSSHWGMNGILHFLHYGMQVQFDSGLCTVSFYLRSKLRRNPEWRMPSLRPAIPVMIGNVHMWVLRWSFLMEQSSTYTLDTAIDLLVCYNQWMRPGKFLRRQRMSEIRIFNSWELITKNMFLDVRTANEWQSF